MLVGHGGSGKTTLGEAMLHVAGVTTRMGRVEDRNTVLDHDPEARERGFTLGLSVASFEWSGHKINLIDTPGFPDFLGEVTAALRVADLAIFVVSAVDGVEVQTEIIWRMAADLDVPRLIFVNKLDRERADFDATLAALQDRFGAGIAPIELPIGAEAAYRGVADLLTDKAFVYDRGVRSEVPMPDELADREHAVHDALVEGIVVADDALLERYLEGETPSPEELSHALTKGMVQASVFPVVCGSATSLVAIDRLLDLVCEIGPSPVDRPGTTVLAGGIEVQIAPDPAGEPLAFVFKSIADQFVGHLSLMKVLSGTVKADTHLDNSRTGADVRLHSLVALRGHDQVPVADAPLGDIIAVAKLGDVHTDDTLAARGKPVTVPPCAWPNASLPVAIKAKTQTDEDKLGTALHRLMEEDPTLRLERNDETRQTVLWGLGETHLRIALDRLQRKFGVGVATADVRVAYRETITGSGEAEGRHKKQSGGKGQFAVAFVRVRPRGRGEGFSFVDAIVGGAIPRQFIPAVEKGVAETMAEGGVLGFPVVDVEVTCYDGKFHAVDSDEMSFRIAGRLGFKDACAKASPVVLEPVSRLEIIVPMDVQGDVLGDLNARRGRVQGTEPAGPGEQVIVALVPTSEALRYAIDLRSMTSGRGRFSATHDHYAPLPPHLADKVIAEAKA